MDWRVKPKCSGAVKDEGNARLCRYCIFYRKPMLDSPWAGHTKSTGVNKLEIGASSGPGRSRDPQQSDLDCQVPQGSAPPRILSIFGVVHWAQCRPCPSVQLP